MHANAVYCLLNIIYTTIIEKYALIWWLPHLHNATSHKYGKLKYKLQGGIGNHKYGNEKSDLDADRIYTYVLKFSVLAYSIAALQFYHSIVSSYLRFQ